MEGNDCLTGSGIVGARGGTGPSVGGRLYGWPYIPWGGGKVVSGPCTAELGGSGCPWAP